MSDFLSNLVGKVESALGVDLQGALQQQLQKLLQPENLQAILAQADQAGLGDKVRSWIGHGDNVPATTDEIRDILGSDIVHNLVARTGLPADTILSTLAHYLPEAVDKTTPAGELPAATPTKEA
ncbi:YidB family protein [Acetobacter indonesiensis]|uniref:YidB family protein n=1 Tax=Acetobacter indonesiensis TaxID=104101 RepID=UPI001F1C496A|nr:YidB family protein [Acetobacter indonesiensis]MCG0994059.1 YidB family protein [Acetobacter indonesiensis]